MNNPAQFDLEGRVALVTGASRGIGRAIALTLARAGASVAVHYVAHRAGAEQTVAEIGATGGRALAVQGDVTDLSHHARIIGAARDGLGGLDILVNNAGATRRAPFLDATPDAWDFTLGVNLKGVYFLTQAAARRMIEHGSGKIVNISSVHDSRPMTDNSIYNITKAGLVMLTKSLALELGPHGLQVNCISPGAILTDETRPRLADPAHNARVLARIPAGRIGAPEDVAAAVLLLASPASDYINGATLAIDGGMLVQ